MRRRERPLVATHLLTIPDGEPSADRHAHAPRQVFGQADFTKSGGCGDLFMWATNVDETLAVVIEWQGAATEANEAGSFGETVTLPEARVSVSLQVGTMLSAGFCTDIMGMPGHRVDGNAPARAGSVWLALEPTATEPIFPTASADLILEAIVFEIVRGGAVEEWRIDRLELNDINVGWLPG